VGGWDGGRSLETFPAAQAPAPASQEAAEEGARSPASLPSPVAEFVSLRQKALPTAEETVRLKKLLRDHGALLGAFERLGDFDADIQNREGLVQFVQDAIMERENPEHEFIAGQVEKLILADNLRAEQSRPHRAELAADKGELVLAYLDAHPERLEFLLSNAAGSPNIRVIENALAVGERRKAESRRIIEELDAAVSN
jgi:hypothetical protein